MSLLWMARIRFWILIVRRVNTKRRNIWSFIPPSYLLFIFSKRAFHQLSYSFFGLKNGLVSCCPLRPPSPFFGLVKYHTFLIFVDRCPHSNKRFNNPFRIWIENAFHHWLLWIKARSVGIWSRQSGLVAFPDGRRPESKKNSNFQLFRKKLLENIWSCSRFHLLPLWWKLNCCLSP